MARCAHPNDIDGYFVCDLMELATGTLQSQLNLLDVRDERQRLKEHRKRGELGEIRNLHGLGRTLVALRIALGLTQRELAERLGVHESQVSRDERNEYHAVTVDRASRILDALGVDLRSAFEEPLVSASSSPVSRTHP
jgi:ribosome-binding protein aMBF1 (putative translation factor)